MRFSGRSGSPAVLAFCAGLLGLAALALFGIVSHLAGGIGALAQAGAFLFEGFSWACLFVPAYLVFSALLLLDPVFRPRRALLLLCSLAPFLTVGVLFQVVSDTGSVVAEALAQSFGVVPSAVLLFLLFVLELLAIVNLPFGRPDSGPDGRREPLSLPTWEERARSVFTDPLPPAPEIRTAADIVEEAFRRPDPAAEPSEPPVAPKEEAVPLAIAGPEPFDVEADQVGAVPDAPVGAVPDAPAGAVPDAPAGAVPDAPVPSDTVPDTQDPIVEPAIVDVPDAPVSSDAVPGAEDPIVEQAAGEVPDAPEGAVPDAPEGAVPDAPAIQEPAPDADSGLDAETGEETDGAADEDAAGSEDGDAEFGAHAEADDGQPLLPLAGARQPVLREAVSRYQGPYSVPAHEVLKQRKGSEYWIVDAETRKAAQILTDALQEFNIQAEVTGIRKGPVITLFEVLPAPGVRISKIANLSDNIALRLAAPSVRIVAPIPGRHAVGIEVPNRTRATVYLKEMLEMDAMRASSYEIPVALGKDILGEAQVIDLTQTPHLLVGGATNSGKSVLVNAIICSILFKKSPDEVRLFLIDPKIVELKLYNDVPHLLTPVITDPKKAFQALQYCISEMERRYTLLDALGVRDIRSFNRKAKKERVARLPYIVIVIDEFADLMATSGKELETTLARLAAMARAVGIHMVLATQRPSIDVITGLIKANIPSRIAFMVANKFDSRIIIDAVGAEKLLGKGDMLFSAAWNPFPVRIQGAFVDDEETESIADYVKRLGPPQYIEDEVFFDEEDGETYSGEPGNDPLMEKALEIIIQQGKASASYLQRRLKIGYNRAARLVEEMEERGIVGPAQGSKPRDILHIPGK